MCSRKVRKAKSKTLFSVENIFKVLFYCQTVGIILNKKVFSPFLMNEKSTLGCSEMRFTFQTDLDIYTFEDLRLYPALYILGKRVYNFYFLYVLRIVSWTFRGPLLGRGTTCWRGRGRHAVPPPPCPRPWAWGPWSLALDPNKIYALIRSKP